MTRLLSMVQADLLAYIQDHPQCGKSEAARACTYGQGASTERERMRTLAALMERGLVKADKRTAARLKVPFALVITPQGKRALDAVTFVNGKAYPEGQDPLTVAAQEAKAKAKAAPKAPRARKAKAPAGEVQA